MKIAFIVSEFPTLSETFVINQITGLLDLGHDVSIFAFSDPHENKIHSDVEKYRLMDRAEYFFDDSIVRSRTRRVLKSVPLFIRHFLNSPLFILRSINIFKYGLNSLSLALFYATIRFTGEKFDIIHCHFGQNGILGAQLKEIGVKGKLVTSFHGNDLSRYVIEKGSDVYEKLFHICDLCLPISTYWEQKLMELGCPRSRLQVHRMGIDINRFECAERGPGDGEIVQILSVGRLIEKKAHKYVIRALAEVVKNHKNVMYLIAGDGPLRKNLEQLVDELNIREYVRFPGKVDGEEVIRLYRQSHVFVLASVTAEDGDQEGIPVVLMEAQASGLPVISTYHSGIPEIVEDGRSGYLVPEKDVSALTEKLDHLISHPEIWPEMGRHGREIVEKEYDVNKLNKKLEEIYQGITSG